MISQQQSPAVDVNTDIPQGSVIARLLFAVYCNTATDHKVQYHSTTLSDDTQIHLTIVAVNTATKLSLSSTYVPVLMMSDSDTQRTGSSSKTAFSQHSHSRGKLQTIQRISTSEKQLIFKECQILACTK